MFIMASKELSHNLITIFSVNKSESGTVVPCDMDSPAVINKSDDAFVARD